jgi:hypothetical protein
MMLFNPVGYGLWMTGFVLSVIVLILTFERLVLRFKRFGQGRVRKSISHADVGIAEAPHDG